MSDAISHARGLSLAFRKAAETAMPSVVTLVAKTKPDRDDLRRLLDDPRFRRLFPRDELPGESRDGQGVPDHPTIPQVGSGVIIDAAGVILTNNHVVQDAEEVIVRLEDGQELKATDVKTDPLSDLAIVRFKPGPGQKLLRGSPGRFGSPQDRRLGDRDRQSVRVGSHGQRRHHQRQRTRHRKDPPGPAAADGCGHQSRQLGRAAGESGRRSRRASTRRLRPAAAAIRASVSRFRRTAPSGSRRNC